MYIKYCSVFFLYFVVINCFCQKGDFFIKNYLPKEYKGLANNFGVTQDNDGLIYIANDNAVLIYDGINWDKCSRQDETTISSINKTATGKIVVGTIDGDIALIEKDEKGRFKFKSVLSKIKEQNQPKETVRQILIIGAATYFLSADKLIELKDSEFKSFSPIENFHTRASVIGKHLFVTEVNNHISVLQNGVLTPVIGTEELAFEKMFFCFKRTATNYILGYRNIGLVSVDYDSINPAKSVFLKLPIEDIEQLNEAEINNGVLLKDGNFVVTTNKNGAFILNKKLKIIKHLNTKSGIFDDNVKAAFQDQNGNLWLALYYGISFIEVNSKVLKYNRESGIKGPVQSAVYFKDKLIIATDKGLQYFNVATNLFENLLDFKSQSWYLYVHKNVLFVSTTNGLYTCDGKKIDKINDEISRAVFSVNLFPNKIFVSNASGVNIYEVKGDQLKLQQKLDLGSFVTSIANDNERIYFSTTENGVYCLEKNQTITVKNLPHKDYEYFVFNYEKQPLIATDSGIYSISKGNYAVKDAVFNKLTNKSQVFRATAINADLIYSEKYETKDKSKFEEGVSYIHVNGNKIVKNVYNLHQLKDISTNLITYDSLQKITFVCSNEGLFLLGDVNESLNKQYTLFLKNIIAQKDTLLSNQSDKVDFFNFNLTLPYKQNDLLFQFGINTFENNNVEFCYLLEGKDEAFSKWNKKSEINYSNLNEGNYTLKVKAKTELTEKEFTISIPFKILPPWYRSLWAYLVYGLLFVALIYAIVKLYSRRLREQNIKLEEVIKQRTSVIEEQKVLVEHKQKEILDSINYAERIQRSFMASESILKKELKNNQRDYFILFKPKDVVSGDFYWAGYLPNQQFVFISADSTGHGVPGAIMSLLNITSIEKALETEQEPSLILNRTRQTIINRLKNDGSEQGGKDGMDCSICIFDFETKQLKIAAANNPVWIYKRTANELIEIRPDKMPVGKHEKDTISFTQQEVILEVGDIVYLPTDGFADQFGGVSGKKYMSKNLRALLFQHANRPMIEQQQLLENEFANWKGSFEQVDDVTIVGIKI